MYTQQDVKEAQRAMTWYIVGYALLSLLLLGGVAVGAIIRNLFLFYAAGLVFCVVSVFYWGMFAGRVRHWLRFLRDMTAGLSHPFEGEVGQIEDEIYIKDGIECIRLQVLTGEESDEFGGRILYYDAAKLPFPAQASQRVRGQLYGMFIKEITIEAE